MSSDLISNLHLDKEFQSSKVVIAREINGCDSSFIVSCVLNHCIKNKKAVLIVSMHNSQSHFQNVGLKMNYNLQKHIDSGLVQFCNLGEKHINVLMLNENVSLQNLFIIVKDNIKLMKEKYETVNVIFDGISHLFDLQFTLAEVNQFCKTVIEIVRSYENSFVFCHFNVVSEDDVTNVISNLISHMAHTVVEVESLSSGWSADVSGHLSIRHIGQKFEDEHIFSLNLKPARYLFKLFDRGVKLFAPGTV